MNLAKIPQGINQRLRLLLTAAAVAVAVAAPGQVSGADLVPLELQPYGDHLEARATALNNHWVVGVSGGSIGLPVKWDRKGNVQKLRRPAGVKSCTPFDINWRNEIVGQCADGIGILWLRDGKIRRLLPLRGDVGSFAGALDDSGNAVGWSQCNPDGTSCPEEEPLLRAVVWKDHGKKRVQLVGKKIIDPDWTLVERPFTETIGISDRNGHIVGHSHDHAMAWRMDDPRNPLVPQTFEEERFGLLQDVTTSGAMVGSLRDFPVW